MLDAAKVGSDSGPADSCAKGRNTKAAPDCIALLGSRVCQPFLVGIAGWRSVYSGDADMSHSHTAVPQAIVADLQHTGILRALFHRGEVEATAAEAQQQAGGEAAQHDGDTTSSSSSEGPPDAETLAEQAAEVDDRTNITGIAPRSNGGIKRLMSSRSVCCQLTSGDCCVVHVLLDSGHDHVITLMRHMNRFADEWRLNDKCMAPFMHPYICSRIYRNADNRAAAALRAGAAAVAAKIQKKRPSFPSDKVRYAWSIKT